MTAAEYWSEPGLGAPKLAVGLGACALAAVTLPLVAGSDAISVAAKTCAAALSVVLIPGSLVVLMVGSRQGLTLLEIFGLGIPVSLTLVQVATVASLMLHLSSRTVAWTWLALLLAGAALAARRMREGSIPVPASEMAIGGLIAALGCALYLKGSPLGGAEDWSHAAIVRRLAFLEAPTIGNFNHSAGVMFTHPLPGTHYAMA